MEENVYVQIYIFLFTLYGGLIIGVVYDLLDIILNGESRRTKGRGKVDLFFWLLAIIIILGILLYSNDGIVRTYTLLGFALGWILYFWLLSRFFRKVIHFLLHGLYLLAKMVLNVFIYPFKWLRNLFYRPYMRAYRIGNQVKDRVKKYFQLPRTIMGQFHKYKKYLEKKGKGGSM